MTGTILTAIGKTKIASATPEAQLQITHVAVGDGNGSYPVLTENMVALANEVWRGTASTPIRDTQATNTLMFESAIPPDIGGFTIREIGIFDVDGDMIAIGHVDPAQVKPLPTTTTAVNMTVRMIIALANAEQTNLVLSVAPVVTHNGLADRDVVGAHPASAISYGDGSVGSFIDDQKQINESVTQKTNKIATPYEFGAFGDGFSHKLSAMFSTLAEAKVKYPFAESLNDEADWCALQAFFNACHNNVYAAANIGGNYVINKTPHLQGNFHKTSAFYGSIDLRVLEPVELDYFAKFEGYFSQFLCSIRCYGYQSNAGDARTRTCKNGVLFGVETPSGNGATAEYIHSITVDNISGYACVMGQNAHFAEVGFVRGGYCGSAPGQGNTIAHYVGANWSNKVDNLAGQLSGSSTITVDQLPAQQTFGLEVFGDNSNTFVVINDEKYLVYAVDRVNSTIQVIPQITTAATTGTLKYIYGGAVLTIGNNSANTVYRRVHAIVAGHGLRLAAMYGSQVVSFTSEFCGSAITTARRNAPNIGSAILSAYFEGNNFDLCEVWSHPTYQGISITQDSSLNPGKIVSLFTFLIGGSRVSTGGYQKLDATITANGKKYAAYDWQKVGTNLTDPLPIKVFATNGQTTTVSCDEKLFSHYGKGSIIYCFQSTTTANGAPTGNIVLNAGSGQTINGGASVTFSGADYQQPLMLVVSRTAANTLKVNAINKAEKSATLVYDPPSIPAGGTESTTVALTGAAMGDLVVASVNRSLAGINMWAYVSAVDTVTVVFKNETAAAVDLAALTIKVKIV